MTREFDAQMLMAEWLFVETVEDIHRRSEDPSSRSRYELLGIAPLLRKLLLDGTPLVNTLLAARPEIVTVFRIRPWQPRENPDNLPYLLRLAGPEIIGDSAYGGVSKIKAFLNTQIGEIEGQRLTVRQVVKYYAHVEGGVHFGKPRSSGEEPMSRMAPVLLGNSNGQIEILVHLGHIVADSLDLLRSSILNQPMIAPGMHRKNPAGYYDLHWTAERYVRLRTGVQPPGSDSSA